MTDDRDPTGMRHLLAGLKESGPMPDDLSDRIRASLDEEQAARAASTQADAEQESTFWSDTGSDRTSARRRPHPTAGRWVLGIAAAAVVAVGVGSVLVVGGDDGASEMASEAGAGSAADEDRSRAGGSGESGDSSPGSSGTPRQVPAFAITQTGTDYTRESLPEQAARLEADPRSAPELSDASLVEGMGTAAGVSDCLARLGHPELQPVVLDVARFGGRPGLLLIAEEAPEGKVRAWAITTGCEPIWQGPFAVPEK